MNVSDITRRSFLTSAAALGALSVAGLSGCVPAGGDTAPQGESSPAADAGKTEAVGAEAPQASAFPSADSAERSWEIAPNPIAEGDIAQELEADLVILGAGQAGSCAARAAAEAGATVIVLEQQPLEGYMVNGSEVACLNNKLSVSRGAPTYQPAELVAECLRRSLNRPDARLLKKWAENAGSHFDWFMEPLGEEWAQNVHSYMTPPPKYWTGEVNGQRNFLGTNSFFGGPGYSLTDAMLVQHGIAQDLGARFLYGTTAVQPVMSNGACVGLIGQAVDGSYIRCKAKKGVLLCGGGFGGNPEMVSEYIGEFSDFWGDEPVVGFDRDGSGICIGLWAGGHMEEDPRAATLSNQSGMAGSLAATAFLRLDDKGERYSNEGLFGAWGQGAITQRISSPTMCCVFDSNWREELEYQAPDHFCVDVSDETLLEQLTEAMASIPVGPEGGDSHVSATPVPFEVNYHYWKADTLEDLASYLGYSGEAAKTFLASVERYNQLAEAGFDEDFGKDAKLMHAIKQPPFYGYKEERNIGNLVVTLCGLRIDHNQAVLDSDNQPIPGLYACGNNSGSRFAVQYMTPMGGTSVGMAQVLGHVLGDYVARLEES